MTEESDLSDFKESRQTICQILQKFYGCKNCPMTYNEIECLFDRIEDDIFYEVRS